MHPHTRRVTNKRLTELLAAASSTPDSAVPAKPPDAPEVNDDELSHLAKDLAYFRAERYREVDAEDVREDDIRHAEAEIAAMFKRDDTL